MGGPGDELFGDDWVFYRLADLALEVIGARVGLLTEEHILVVRRPKGKATLVATFGQNSRSTGLASTLNRRLRVLSLGCAHLWADPFRSGGNKSLRPNP